MRSKLRRVGRVTPRATATAVAEADKRTADAPTPREFYMTPRSRYLKSQLAEHVDESPASYLEDVRHKLRRYRRPSDNLDEPATLETRASGEAEPQHIHGRHPDVPPLPIAVPVMGLMDPSRLPAPAEATAGQPAPREMRVSIVLPGQEAATDGGGYTA